jgi:hypothetical protein
VSADNVEQMQAALENPATPVMHGMLTSQYPIDKVSTFAIGLKVKFGFSIGRSSNLSAAQKETNYDEFTPPME